MHGVSYGRFLARIRAWRVVLAVVLGARIALATAAADPAEAKKIFTTRCMACHTFGKGVKVGPDLKGVTERRQRPWLLRFIRSSQTVIGSGDPTATGLFEQFKQQRMPDWSDLSDDQITSILDWLAAAGPDQRAADERAAESATAAELAAGRALFHGTRALARGGAACASCHAVRDADGSRHGGTLAADLTAVYAQYQDVGMTLFLRHPCFQRYPDSTLTAFLVPEEAFSIKAYLREVALGEAAAGPGPGDHPGPAVAKTVDDPAAPPPPAAPPAALARRVGWAPQGPAAAPAPTRGATLPGELLFLAFPYAALVVFLAGLGVRHAIARRDPAAIANAGAEAWHALRGSPTWRVGLGVTALLHLAALVVPDAIQTWNGVALRLYLLEATGFVLGVVALIGIVQLIWRGDVHGVADHALLSLVVIAIGSGLATAVLYRWGAAWSLVTVVPYLRSLARGAPAPELVQQLPFLVRLHTFTWFALLAVVPFTSAARILVALGDRALLAVARPIGALGRAGRRSAARLSPARWLWPEEDAVEPPAGERS
jgi:nitrate reductase gamma subunit